MSVRAGGNSRKLKVYDENGSAEDPWSRGGSEREGLGGGRGVQRVEKRTRVLAIFSVCYAPLLNASLHVVAK